MDKKEIINIVRKYADLVEEKYPYSKVILFGSYAKGNPHKDSDIDVAVILNNRNNFDSIQLELMRLRRKIDSRIEPHPFTKKEFENSNPFVNEIILHGLEVQPS